MLSLSFLAMKKRIQTTYNMNKTLFKFTKTTAYNIVIIEHCAANSRKMGTYSVLKFSDK